MTTHHMRITERLNAPTQRLRTTDGPRFHTTDIVLTPSVRITTGMRITPEKAPPAPVGSFGVCWTGMAGDGTSRVPDQIDIDTVVNDIEGGLSLLSDADQRAIRAKLTKFSGRESAAPSAAGIATNDNNWAAESARRVAGEMQHNADVSKAYNDFWERHNKLMAVDLG
jgi:hypothetical protein